MKRVRKENDVYSISLPEDLIIQILSKMPTKSLVKLIIVSKLWSSIIRSRYFVDLYMNRSLTRPRFLFTFNSDNIRFFHSISQEAAPSSYTTRTSILLSPDTRHFALRYNTSQPIRGLLCCQDLDKVVVSNPSTGQFLVLPKVRTRRKRISRFLGYDPIKDEYKVLCMTVLQVSSKYGPVVSEEHQVFTLDGTQKQKKEAKWRMIECKLPHCPATQGLCMTNGVLYYGAWSNSDKHGSLVVAFDVRLEEFTLVKLPDHVKICVSYFQLVNYRKKVALVNYIGSGGKLDIWVLEDVDKQEWSNIFVVVPSWFDLAGQDFFYCGGATISDEFIFVAPYSFSPPVYMIIYDRKKHIARRVEIEGIGDRFSYMKVFLDHVECPLIL